MICRNCGRNIPDDSELCPECGAVVNRENVHGQAGSGNGKKKVKRIYYAPSSKGKKRSGWLIAILIIVLVLIVGTVSVFIIARNRMKQQQTIEHQIEELINDHDIEIEELMEIMEELQGTFPEKDEKFDELFETMKEEIKKRMEEEDIEVPEEFDDIFEQYGSFFDDGDGTNEMYDEFMDMFRRIVDQQKQDNQ